MRKRGSYITDKRLKFKRGLQKEFIREIKEKSGLTWKDLADKLNISEYTLRVDWQKERSTIPYVITKIILKEYPFESFENIKANWVEEILEKNWGQKLGGNKNSKKITIPKRSNEVAELLGVILGDGHLRKNELTITGHIYERFHHYYISKIIEKLFGLDSKIFQSYTNKNTTILRTYSTHLINYLKNNKMVTGNKIVNKASLPKWVFNKKEFIYGTLRGLFDTDGGVYHKQKNYKRIIIEFQTHSPYIREDIIMLLKKGGFTFSKSVHNIRIQNQKEVHKFFNLVGSSNPKNIIRYKHFIRKGYIPLKENLNTSIINFKESVPFKMQS